MTHFSTLKLNAFMATDFIAVTNMKNNYFSLIIAGSPIVTKGIETGVLFILKKTEEGTFFPKKSRG